MPGSLPTPRLRLALSLAAALWATAVHSATPQPAPGDGTTASPAEGDAAAANRRMQAVEGSLSDWSGQFNLLYKGSSAAHPFAEDAPNPGHAVPPPLVTLSGTVSTRYRFDPKTTLGLGSGLTTETPFQGPHNTTLADPYIDLAHSFNFAGMHHRLDVQLTQWTNHEHYSTYGYRNGVSFLGESLYTFQSGVTLGVQLGANANTFAAGAYNRSQQTAYGFGVYPSLEYRLSESVDFRTVLGFLDAHNRNISDDWRYQHPDAYQTIGLGINLTRAFYLYLFVKGYPVSHAAFASDRTLCGFSTIINLF